MIRNTCWNRARAAGWDSKISIISGQDNQAVTAVSLIHTHVSEYSLRARPGLLLLFYGLFRHFQEFTDVDILAECHTGLNVPAVHLAE
jgi:hypothetical protein